MRNHAPTRFTSYAVAIYFFILIATIGATLPDFVVQATVILGGAIAAIWWIALMCQLYQCETIWPGQLGIAYFNALLVVMLCGLAAMALGRDGLAENILAVLLLGHGCLLLGWCLIEAAKKRQRRRKRVWPRSEVRSWSLGKGSRWESLSARKDHIIKVEETN